MSKRNQFVNFGLSCLSYKSKQDLVENLYLKSIVDSYQRVDKAIHTENDIRDRFIYDFYHNSVLLKGLIQTNILYVNWEKWVFKNDQDLGRTDLSFGISGFEYVVECKRLKSVSQQYIKEGLYRFINNEYSKNESYSGMIGFVIEGDISKIKDGLKDKCINEKFVDTSYSKESLDEWNHNFKTTHKREDNSNINIQHLFFEFSININ